MKSSPILHRPPPPYLISHQQLKPFRVVPLFWSPIKPSTSSAQLPPPAFPSHIQFHLLHCTPFTYYEISQNSRWDEVRAQCDVYTLQFRAGREEWGDGKWWDSWCSWISDRCGYMFNSISLSLSSRVRWRRRRVWLGGGIQRKRQRPGRGQGEAKESRQRQGRFFCAFAGGEDKFTEGRVCRNMRSCVGRKRIRKWGLLVSRKTRWPMHACIGIWAWKVSKGIQIMTMGSERD